MLWPLCARGTDCRDFWHSGLSEQQGVVAVGLHQGATDFQILCSPPAPVESPREAIQGSFNLEVLGR